MALKYRAYHFATAAALVALLGACAEDPTTSIIRPLKSEVPGFIGGSPEALLRTGDEARATGNLPLAVSLYRRAVALAPNNRQAYIKLGTALNETGAPAEAAEAFRGGLALGEKDADSLRGLGNALVSLNQPQLAYNQFTAAKEIRADAATFNGLGVALDMMGDHTRAQDNYRQGLALQTDNLALQTNYGLSLALSGEFDKSIKTLRDTVRHPKAGTRNRQNLALVYGLSGDMDQAAQISRIDLDETTVSRNLTYYTTLRGMSNETARAMVLGGAAIGYAATADR